MKCVKQKDEIERLIKISFYIKFHKQHVYASLGSILVAFKYLHFQNIVKTGKHAVATEPQTEVADEAGSSLLCTSQELEMELPHGALIPHHLEFTGKKKNPPCPAC